MRFFRVCTGASLIALLCALILVGCGTSSTTSVSVAATPLIAKDALNNPITIPATAPKQIVSLGATDSEILAALGLTDRVVAVDAFTDYPASMAAKTKVTDNTGKVNVEAVVALKPDLVLGFGGEDGDAEQQLVQLGIKVVDLPAQDLAGSLLAMRLVGQLTHTTSQADTLVQGLQQRIDAVKSKAASAQKVTVYMEVGYTPAPPYAFGGGSFGDEMIRDAGGTNIFADNTTNGGYPAVSEEAIIKANPQVIILTEGKDYGGDPSTVGQRPNWSTIAAVQQKHVYALDPNLVQRPGPRIVDGLEAIARALHPEVFGSR